jgi:hypothetical protein
MRGSLGVPRVLEDKYQVRLLKTVWGPLGFFGLVFRAEQLRMRNHLNYIDGKLVLYLVVHIDKPSPKPSCIPSSILLLFRSRFENV